MSRQHYREILQNIFDTQNSLSDDIIIAQCDFIDSLALMSFVVFLKKNKIDINITDIIKCKTIGQLLDCIEKSSIHN